MWTEMHSRWKKLTNTFSFELLLSGLDVAAQTILIFFLIYLSVGSQLSLSYAEIRTLAGGFWSRQRFYCPTLVNVSDWKGANVFRMVSRLTIYIIVIKDLKWTKSLVLQSTFQVHKHLVMGSNLSYQEAWTRFVISFKWFIAKIKLIVNRLRPTAWTF